MDWIVRHEKKHLIRLREGNNPLLIFNDDVSPSMANFLFKKSNLKNENKSELTKPIKYMTKKLKNSIKR